MTIPVVLPSFRWPSKKAAFDAFRLLHTGGPYAAYDRITDPSHDLMLREALDLHPEASEKIGGGVDYFYVGLTSDGDKFNVRPDATGIWIKRVDGSEVDFSYRTCIQNHTEESDAKEGLRLAVEDRRLSYRDDRIKAGTFASDVSGIVFSDRNEGQVIYDEPSWGQLTYRFAEAEGGWDRILVHSGHGGILIGSHLMDTGVHTRWLEFYDRYANRRLATASEAAARPRPRQDAWTP
ncbi:DCL family protein [Microbacterium sp. NPDC077184]|uniref:DCL family protein n=1 Tax=Microbacterium sp. NPDC077184 TaxID=3154764 RepID=UPI003430783C